MHSLLRTCLIGLLVASLIEVPVLASPSTPLGVVVQAERARLGTAEALGGATVFAGDSVATDVAGSLRIRVGAVHIYLLANSAAALGDADAAGLRATVVRGTVGFSSSAGQMIEVRASDAVVRPKAAQPTHGQVSLVNAGELVVTSYRGSLEIAVDGEIFSVPEASSYRVLLVPEPQEPEGAGKKKAKRRRALFFWLVFGGAAAGTGIAVWRGRVSPDDP